MSGESRKLKTHCNRGHEFTPENTGTTRAGNRMCMECDRLRKRAYQQRQHETRERQVETVCPLCKQVRMVVWTTAKRLEKFPHACRSCSRKVVRGKMTFAAATCAKCGNQFAGRSGAARFCDTCAKRKPVAIKDCPICGKSFAGYKNKTACSDSCLRRIRKNVTYFGGRMMEAEGWEDKTCQICRKHVAKKYHVHHVYGHPDHSRLAILCAGCHDAVSKMASRKNFDIQVLKRVVYFVLAQRAGCDPVGIIVSEDE